MTVKKEAQWITSEINLRAGHVNSYCKCPCRPTDHLQRQIWTGDIHRQTPIFQQLP